jgi:hypothetical protein
MTASVHVNCTFGADSLFTLVGSKVFEIKDLEEIGTVRELSCQSHGAHRIASVN